MPRLYIEEYTSALAGKTLCIACREGILRDHFNAVIADIKFLSRHGIETVFYHNMPNRFANHKYFRTLSDRLPETRINRVPPEKNFYSHVIDHEENVFKLIFLERKPLVDQQGQKINTITTQAVRQSCRTWGDLIANINFKGALEQICTRIDHGLYDRVHILPAGKNIIRHELFTIEGAGTLIANNFREIFQPVASDKDMRIVEGILQLYRHQGFLKHRSKDYLWDHRDNFYATLIDGIVVGCVEKKIVDDQTIEIAALAISTKFRSQRVGVFTVRAFMDAMQDKGYSRFIALTNNPKLKRLFYRLGFALCKRSEYALRQQASPTVPMFFKEIE